MKRTKKLLSVLLTAIMVVTSVLFPMQAVLAAENHDFEGSAYSNPRNYSARSSVTGASWKYLRGFKTARFS